MYNGWTTSYREGSGWTTVVKSVGITRPELTQALITDHDDMRSKYVHQVTACCLDILVHEAFEQINITDTIQQWDFISWQIHIQDINPTFKYWSLIFEMDLHLLLFLRAIPSRNFKLHLILIESMLPRFFSLDHYSYARWWSVHFYDMNMSPHTNSDMNDAFINEVMMMLSSSSQKLRYHKNT